MERGWKGCSFASIESVHSAEVTHLARDGADMTYISSHLVCTVTRTLPSLDEVLVSAIAG